MNTGHAIMISFFFSFSFFLLLNEHSVNDTETVKQ